MTVSPGASITSAVAVASVKPLSAVGSVMAILVKSQPAGTSSVIMYAPGASQPLSSCCPSLRLKPVP